jgi:hypothetical protein
MAKRRNGNLLTRNPVAAAVLVPIIVTVGARFGLDVDEDTALAIGGVLLLLLGGVARQLATPTADPKAADGTPLVKAAELPPAPGAPPYGR